MPWPPTLSSIKTTLVRGYMKRVIYCWQQAWGVGSEKDPTAGVGKLAVAATAGEGKEGRGKKCSV